MDFAGLALCSRYSYPPNSLSLCGPDRQNDLKWYSGSRQADHGTIEILTHFSTLYPYLRLIAGELNRSVAFVHTSPYAGILLGKIISLFVKDVVLTNDELRGLMANKLTSNQDPNGKTLFSDWLRKNRHSIGTEYTSELNRHFNWRAVA